MKKSHDDIHHYGRVLHVEGRKSCHVKCARCKLIQQTRDQHLQNVIVIWNKIGESKIYYTLIA